MDEKKSYWFEQPYMPRMKNIAVAPVILEDGRLSFCVPGDDGLMTVFAFENGSSTIYSFTEDPVTYTL